VHFIFRIKLIQPGVFFKTQNLLFPSSTTQKILLAKYSTNMLSDLTKKGEQNRVPFKKKSYNCGLKTGNHDQYRTPSNPTMTHSGGPSI
jgi:hypothetical protein